MADQLPAPSLARAREAKINELSTHFANDDLSLDELEQRIERVYKAANAAELETITADLRGVAPASPAAPGAKVGPGKGNAPAVYDVASSRMLSLMSSTRRVGHWTMPSELSLVAIMSDTKIDFTQAVLASDVVELDLHTVMASLKIIVPPGMRVVVESSSIMSNVSSRADSLSHFAAPATTNAPVLRLTGFALMSDVKVVVRRRELSVEDDEE